MRPQSHTRTILAQRAQLPWVTGSVNLCTNIPSIARSWTCKNKSDDDRPSYSRELVDELEPIVLASIHRPLLIPASFGLARPWPLTGLRPPPICKPAAHRIDEDRVVLLLSLFRHLRVPAHESGLVVLRHFMREVDQITRFRYDRTIAANPQSIRRDHDFEKRFDVEDGMRELQAMPIVHGRGRGTLQQAQKGQEPFGWRLALSLELRECPVVGHDPALRVPLVLHLDHDISQIRSHGRLAFCLSRVSATPESTTPRTQEGQRPALQSAWRVKPKRASPGSAWRCLWGEPLCSRNGTRT